MKHNADLQATTGLLFFFGVAQLGTAIVLRSSERPTEENVVDVLKDPLARVQKEADLSDSSILQLATSHGEDLLSKGGQNTTQTPRQVYIDFGANWANTLRLYEDIGDSAWIHKAPWEVYAFEASPFIQPYLENFIAYLNGQRARPPLTVPPSGSSLALNEYAPRYGCPAASKWAPEAAWNAMRSCMFRVFKKQLSQLHPDPGLSDKALIADRLSAANEPPPVGKMARFVSVPAAAGAADGMLNLGGMTAEQMIRGGAISKPVQGLPEMQVPLVNVVSWLVGYFKKQDYVIVKMDIEGAEFSVLNALLDEGQACLIDVLMIECHASLGDCDQLLARLGQHHCIKVLREGYQGYRGWDHYSGPDTYFALDPREATG